MVDKVTDLKVFFFADGLLQDKRANWHSTPFEVRLERVLNEGAAKAFMV